MITIIDSDKVPCNVEEIIKSIVKRLKIENVNIAVKEATEKDLGDYEGLFVRYDSIKSDADAVIFYERYVNYDTGVMYLSVYRRMYKFLELSGYEVNNENRILMLILHELGHCDWLSLLLEYDMIDYHEHIRMHAESAIPLGFTRKDIEEFLEDGVDVVYMFRADENYADSFAIKYFIAAKRWLEEDKIEMEWCE